MTLPKWSFYILMFVAAVFVAHPYFGSIGWSVILAVILYPVFEGWKKVSSNVKAILLSVGYLCLIILPAVIICYFAVHEVMVYFSKNPSVDSVISSVKENVNKIPYVGHRLAADITSERFQNMFKALNLSTVKKYFDHMMVTNEIILHLLMSLLISSILLYQLLISGKSIKKYLSQFLSRVPHSQKILNIAILSLRGTVTSSLINAMVVSVIMTIVYFSFGLPMALMLGLITFVCALIPFLVIVFYFIIGGYLILTSQWVAGIAIICIGLLVNSLADNILQPKILARTASMPFYISFGGIIFGLASMGPLGIFLGPTIFYTAQQAFLLGFE